MAIFDTRQCVAFTGHRSYNGERYDVLLATIRELYNEGYTTFLSGMALGFDMAAAEAVISLRQELPSLRLICVIPFEGQQRGFPQQERERFERIVASADEAVTLLPKYQTNAFLLRNDFLVENSSLLVAYFTGESGGTAYTVKKATKRALRLINLHLNPQQKLDFI